MAEADIVTPIRADNEPANRQTILNSFLSANLGVPLVVSLLLIATSFYDYLLFHTLAELIAVTIGMMLFAAAWNVYRYSQNHFLMFIACGYFWIAIIDLFHALSYNGMPFFDVTTSALSIELWLSGRFMESLTLLIAPVFLVRPLYRARVFLAYMLAASLVTFLIFNGLFPHVFEEGVGLTPFKVYSEYVIICILGAALWCLLSTRQKSQPLVVNLMAVSIVLTMIAELAFTFYISAFGLSNLVGHIFKVFSFWLIFYAVIRSTLVRPYDRLQKEVEVRKQTEKALTASNRAMRVLSRTNEAMVGTDNEQELIEHACNIIIEAGGYRLAWIGYKHDDEDRTVHCMAHAGIDAAFLRSPSLTWEELEEGGFPPGKAIREEMIVLVQDIFKDNDCVPCREDARIYGFASVIALPLYINKEVFGVLSIYAEQANAFSIEETNLLAELANDISYSIETMRTRKESQQVRANLDETEKKFRKLTEESLVGVYIMQGNAFKYVNPRMAEILGYDSAADVIGKVSPKMIIYPDDLPVLINHLREWRDGKLDAMNYGFRFITRDGQVRDAEVYGSASDYAGKPAVLGTFLDVTERKNAERIIKASENRLRTIIEAEPECVKMLDAQGKVLQMNPAGLTFFGVESFSDIEGKPIIDYIDEPYREAFQALTEMVFAGESGVLELEITSSDGVKRTVETHAVPIIEDDEVVSLLAVTRDISHHKLAEKVLRESAEHTQLLLSQAVESVALTIEKRDPYTAGHQQRVADLAVLIARQMGMTEDQVTGIHLGGVIHDIGKIYIPAEILNRPGRLTDSEFTIVKTHPEVGYDIMKGVDFPWPVNDIIYQHHERMDGSGYPQGLKGDEITLEARIIAVADVVEAISSHRPYRPALGMPTAIEEIKRGKGTIYDPDVVDAFLVVYEQGKLQV